MDIHITARKLKVPDSVFEYIRGKMEKCRKFFKNITRIDVTISKQKYIHTVDVLLHLTGQTIRVTQESEDIRSAVDLSVDKIEKQLRKRKERIKDRRRGYEKVASDEFVQDASWLVELTRRKLIPESMDLPQAKRHLEINNFMFWIFKNMESGLLSVIYRKADLSYGLMEIEKNKNKQRKV
ncbi:MAG: Ribosome-associated factor Y [Elusimicrobia bacterium ADurb.Bin231]|nr:MAG: Ribosome-associated factor Y [Elusimicrobia bacterium ADurb.Bin231]